tara:strand:+ start:12044 stop:12637 length:594 start_codon:yes stop_codon:yes gene_type:complete
MSIEQLTNNIYRMTTAELIGLAKNQFLPEAIQIGIAEHPYARAHWYLAENSGLTKKARDLLWSDRVNKGYSLKAMLVANGHYIEEPERYRQLYNRFPSSWNRSFWRMKRAFFGRGYSWTGNRNGSEGTPTDLLHAIYDRFYASERRAPGNHSAWSRRSDVIDILSAPGCDTELAVKISTELDPDIRSSAFKRIVELS